MSVNVQPILHHCKCGLTPNARDGPAKTNKTDGRAAIGV
jgi:hypothetical protein